MRTIKDKSGDRSPSDWFRYARESLAHLHGVFALLVLLAGGIYVVQSVRTADRVLRSELLARTRLLAAAINPARINALQGTAADQGKPEFRRLSEQLVILRQASADVRAISLIGRDRNDQFFCFVDSGPAPAVAWSNRLRAGEAPVLRQALLHWQAVVDGPVRDQDGAWFAAAVPVRDPRQGQPLAALLVEVVVSTWNGQLLAAAGPGILVTLVVLALVGLSHVLAGRHQAPKTAAGRQTVPLEPALLVAIGVVLSLFCTWRACVRDRQLHRRNFQLFGDNATELIARNFNFINTFELEGLAGFLQHSPEISRSEFDTYVRHLSQHAMVQVWAWVAVVPAAVREQFEASVQAGGMPSYRIWEKGADGRPTPATGRPYYYPVVYAAPGPGNEAVLGFDLGSERRRQAAIEEAIASKLPTATEPLQLVHEWADKKSILALQPVMNGTGRPVRGFAVAAIRINRLFGVEPEKFNGTQMAIAFLRSQAPPEILASTNGLGEHPGALKMFRPVLAFGKVLAIIATGSRMSGGFMLMSRALFVLVTGLLLTAAVTVLATTLTRRGLELSFLVAEQTSTLSKTEERLHQLAANTRTVYWECDPQGLYTSVGPGAMAVYGYEPEELIGKMHFYDLHPVEGREEFKAMALAFFATRQASFEFPNPIETRDGRILTVSTSGMPILGDDGTLAGYYGTDRDITEREQLIAELKQKREEALAANQAKSNFLTNMSHEVRTPINGIIGLADLLRDSDLKKDQRDFVDIIDTSSRLLLDLVNEILDFSRIEAGRITPVEEHFDLRRLVEDIASSLALSAHLKNVELYCCIAPNVPLQMHGDDFHLRQILVNLAGNAVKFTDQGEVVITVGLQGVQAGKMLFRFAVRDTGIGIARDQQQRVFQTFFQADSSIHRRYGGSGLGLAIVKRLVEILGGKIGFYSEFGQGTEFYFALPLAVKADAPPLAAAWPAELQGAEIVVIEGHDGIRQELEARLAAVGMRVRTAGSMADAADILPATEAGAFVLLDLDQPELVSEDRDAGLPAGLQRPELRLIGLTRFGRGIPDGRIGSLPLRAELHKPVKTCELMDALRKAMAAAESRPATAVETETGSRRADPGLAVTLPAMGDADRPILLAEDNVVNQKVALALLHKIGLRAEIASNGQEVLARLKQKDYRLVLMDVQMPGIDGLEATRLIRDPATPVRNHNITIIALTAHAVGGYKESCLAAGMDDYIAKPITAAGLRDVLKRWLEQPQTAGR